MSEPQNPANVNQSADQTASLQPNAGTQDFKTAVPPPEARAPANVQVPGYRILGVLGRGGMGVVYKAVQEKADRLVALKMILAGAHADPHDRTRFHVEASAAARMSHPNIVQLYEVGETPDGFPYFSLEFVSGGTLADRLKQGPLRPNEAAALLEALARAMQYAHERGIVHRDLKPLNVLLQSADSKLPMEETGKSTMKPIANTMRESQSAICNLQSAIPKISDFGLAKQLDSEDGLTRTGAIMGSPSYMAPEQAFGQSKNVGPAADIYALGAILYECLTGRPPFKGASVADTLEQVRTMEPITLKAYAKEMPRDLETICLHCLHKEPHKRYASAEALADDLRRFQEHKPITVRPVSKAERVWRWCRRNPGWAAMIATVAVSLLGATGAMAYAVLEVSAKNESLKAEVLERTKQESIAKSQTKLANEKTILAEARGEQSLKAVGLFATDARQFCEDAMVPGESRKMLFKVLIEQMETQANQAAGEATIDALRNKTFMYQTLCAVTQDFRQLDESDRWYAKGIASVDQWNKLRPDDPVALGFRATLLDLHGNNLKRQNKLDKAKESFARSLEIRKKLAGSLDVILPANAVAAAKLADSLDSLDEYEDSIKLRTRVLKLLEEEENKCVKDKIAAMGDAKRSAEADKRCLEARQRSFSYRDALCETYKKSGLHAIEYEKRKDHLTMAFRMSEELHNQRKSNRNVLLRQALVAKMLGELEYSYGKLAEKGKKTDEAQKHFEAAEQVYNKLPGITQKLATSDELLEGLREYSRSFYSAGLAKKRSNPAEARKDFQTSWNIRKQVADDYGAKSNSAHLKLDLYFSQLALGEVKATMTELDNVKFIFSFQEPDGAYRLACLYALAIDTIEETRRPNPLTEADKRLQRRYRHEAIECLRIAHDGGFSDFFQSNIDADLDAIRDDPAMKEFEATHHYLLGVQELKRGDAKKAQIEFEKAQEFAEGWLKDLPKDNRQAQVKGVWLCAHVQLGHYAEAIQIADKMLPKLGGNKAAKFRLVRVYALASVAAKDDKLKEECLSKAFTALNQAVDGRLKQALEAEEDLDSLRGDPRYRETKRRFEKAPKSLF